MIITDGKSFEKKNPAQMYSVSFQIEYETLLSDLLDIIAIASLNFVLVIVKFSSGYWSNYVIWFDFLNIGALLGYWILTYSSMSTLCPAKNET